MFVFTARVSKKHITAALLAIIVIVAAVLLFTQRGESADAAAVRSSVAKTNEDRVSFLNSLGWIVSDEPIEEQTVVIPKDFSEVYAEYNKLQQSQGFDLTKYAGREAVRYTYAVKNYPTGEENIVADMIVYRGRVIAGDVQSASLGGFMAPLSFPETGAKAD